MTPGFFIALEGLDGSGKTTQAALLASYLGDQGHQVVVTREPGGTLLGEEIRALLLGDQRYAMLPTTEALLFAAARAQHVAQVIAPAVAAGKIVISDRFADSSLAYQGGGQGLDMRGLEAVQAFALSGVEPDLRILLDLPVEVGLRRRFAGAEPTNRLDESGVAFYNRVRARYFQLVDDSPASWLVVDACRDPHELGQQIALTVASRLSSARSIRT